MFLQTKKEGTNYELNEQRKKSEGGWFSGFFGKKSKKSKSGYRIIHRGLYLIQSTVMIIFSSVASLTI